MIINKIFIILQRNGHWMGENGNMGVNNEGYNASDSSQRGSQAALLAVSNERHRWPKGKDFLFSTWAFVVGKSDLIFYFLFDSFLQINNIDVSLQEHRFLR